MPRYFVTLIVAVALFMETMDSTVIATSLPAIARDLGEALATGGYLTELTRTKVGSFTRDNAIALKRIDDEPIERFVKPVS